MGGIFDKEIKIADRVGRKDTKPEIAKPLHNPYLPSPKALANGRDPVLAYAVQQMGVKITPEGAGKAFPYEWPPE